MVGLLAKLWPLKPSENDASDTEKTQYPSGFWVDYVFRKSRLWWRGGDVGAGSGSERDSHANPNRGQSGRVPRAQWCRTWEGARAIKTRRICIAVLHLFRYDAGMPTQNPRLSVTLTPELGALLDRLSALTGNSKSALVADLLGEAGPIFERMITVLEAAETLKAQATGGIAEIGAGLARAQSRMEAQLGLCLDDLDEGVRPILEAAEKVTRRGARGMGAARPRATRSGATPMSNRGVKNSKDRENRTKPGVNPKNSGGVK